MKTVKIKNIEYIDKDRLHELSIIEVGNREFSRAEVHTNLRNCDYIRELSIKETSFRDFAMRIGARVVNEVIVGEDAKKYFNIR